MAWDTLADDSIIEKTAEALKKRGIEVFVVSNGEEAKKKVLELIPEGSTVMEASSTTMNEIGITQEIEESGKYDSVRKKLHGITDAEERNRMRRQFLSAPYAIGSVQAVTEDGKLVVASASGSQISFYAFDSQNVILAVSTMKIVKDLDAAFKRIHERALPLENKRVHDQYGWNGSYIGKLMVLERDRPGRTRVIFVKEQLGF
ncbi:MAG: lactate utilization protein [Candidatus Micrarchaeota archaeon]|nr:lactate utilization protein [Candidatus Micrarchaeota archaeon]